MRFRNQALEVLVRAVPRIDPVVVADVVTVIAGRCGYRHEPDATRPQILACVGVAIVDVVEFLDHAFEVTDAVAVAVVERADEDLITDPSVSPAGKVCNRGLLGVGAGGRQSEDAERRDD